MNVAVPASLLEDIFRLLDCLGDLSNQDDLHFRKKGHKPRFDHDSALWKFKLKLKIKRLQSCIVETYLQTIDDITQYEMDALEEWLADGNSVYDNPFSIYEENGRLMDFINGCRIGFDMAEDFLRSYVGGADDVDCDDCEEDIPWHDEDPPCDEDLPF